MSEAHDSPEHDGDIHSPDMERGTWTEEFAPEDRSFVELKGWQTPGDVLQSYRHLESLVGSDTVRIPGEGSEPEEIAEFWSRLGRPDVADGYEISAPPDMEDYSADMADWFCQVAHDCHMPQEMAQRFHDKYVEKYISETSRLQANLAEERQHAETELRAAWGPAFDQKRIFADRAVRALGGARLVDELKHSGLSASVALAQAFAAAGEQLFAEDYFIQTDGNSGFRHSAESAQQEIGRLRKDPEFMAIYGDRHHLEHEAAQQRMNQLYAIAREGV